MPIGSPAIARPEWEPRSDEGCCEHGGPYRGLFPQEKTERVGGCTDSTLKDWRAYVVSAALKFEKPAVEGIDLSSFVAYIE